MKWEERLNSLRVVGMVPILSDWSLVLAIVREGCGKIGGVRFRVFDYESY